MENASSSIVFIVCVRLIFLSIELFSRLGSSSESLTVVQKSCQAIFLNIIFSVIQQTGGI